MSEEKRPTRRGRRPRTSDSPAADVGGEPNPYRDAPDAGAVAAADAPAPRPKRPPRKRRDDAGAEGTATSAEGSSERSSAPPPPSPAPDAAPAPAPAAAHDDQGAPARGRGRPPRGGGRRGGRHQGQEAGPASHGADTATGGDSGAPGGHQGGGQSAGHPAGGPQEFRNNRRGNRRGRGRFRKDRRNRGGDREVRETREPREPREFTPPTLADGTIIGWFDSQRDAGFVRRAQHSYLPEPTDPFVQPHLVRQHNLRRGDKIEATWGRDHRGRSVVVEIVSLNDGPPVVEGKRPDFNTLVASYPDRKLTLETGQPAKAGPELTRRAIDLIAPVGYGQRALIVAPARAGKTTLLQAIVQGVATNHPDAELFILLVDERPEEVSEMITWGYGEVVASSFDMPAKRHVEVADMVLERARRLVEKGKDVVIVLDSITRLARAHNTVERGTGRTLSGGLDSSAMQKPKAFFGSARMIAPEHGGGSLTIIATALVETGSRMDDVIFEEFKGTGNCEIKLDRGLADRRIYPAIDIAVSGTRREEKLYRPDQVQKVHLLRRGLAQMPPQAGMEWLIKRIAGTSNNDSLLDGL